MSYIPPSAFKGTEFTGEPDRPRPVSKAQEWRAKGQTAALAEAQELELPSGMKILARRPGPAFGAAYAQLPLILTSKVSGDRPLSAVAAEPTEREQNLAVYLRDLVLYCVVAPVVSLTPGPDEMHPREIPNDDLEFILGWAARRYEADDLEAFRTRRRNGGTGSDRSDIWPAAVDVAGHPGSDAGTGLRPGGDGRLGSVKG